MSTLFIQENIDQCNFVYASEFMSILHSWFLSLDETISIARRQAYANDIPYDRNVYPGKFLELKYILINLVQFSETVFSKSKLMIVLRELLISLKQKDMSNSYSHLDSLKTPGLAQHRLSIISPKLDAASLRSLDMSDSDANEDEDDDDEGNDGDQEDDRMDRMGRMGELTTDENSGDVVMEDLYPDMFSQGKIDKINLMNCENIISTITSWSSSLSFLLKKLHQQKITEGIHTSQGEGPRNFIELDYIIVSLGKVIFRLNAHDALADVLKDILKEARVSFNKRLIMERILETIRYLPVTELAKDFENFKSVTNYTLWQDAFSVWLAQYINTTEGTKSSSGNLRELNTMTANKIVGACGGAVYNMSDHTTALMYLLQN